MRRLKDMIIGRSADLVIIRFAIFSFTYLMFPQQLDNRTTKFIINMKKQITKLKQCLSLFTLGLSIPVMLMSQDESATFYYDITFAGRGEITTVEAVIVENLTQNTSLELDGNDVLRLTDFIADTTGVNINENPITTLQRAKIYPNPAVGESTLLFPVANPGNVTITVTNLSGQVILIHQFTLAAGTYSASLPAMPDGVYVVGIICENSSTQAFRWVSLGGNDLYGDIRLNGCIDEKHPLVAKQTKTKQQKTNGVVRLLSPKQQPAQTKNTSGQNIIESLAYYVDNDANIIEMLYTEGDLLRFTGISGNMTTIVMNQPTCSHDITFDFYPCTDAAGNHYAIVNVGGMLWMAEDLRMVSTGISLIPDATSWTDTYSVDDAKVAYYNYDNFNASQGAYYNYKGALMALPEGWKLPTQGEIDYMVNALGGYSVTADKLKSRQSGAWGVQPTGTDSVYFCGVAGGELNTQGSFTGKGSLMRYWTRSTKNMKPNYWGVQSNTVQNTANEQIVKAPEFTGFCVRGCRPAPSAYDDVIELFNAKEGSSKITKAFTSGPLGGMYTVTQEKKNLWKSFNDPTATNYTMQYKNYHTSQWIPLTNNSGYKNKLQKAAAQDNVNGKQNLAIALWSRGVNVTGSTDLIDGDGYISIVLYGDSTQNYAKIDSIQLPTQYTIPYTDAFGTTSNTIYNNSNPGYLAGTRINRNDDGNNATLCLNESLLSGVEYTTLEPSKEKLLQGNRWYAQRMQLLSADFNTDGIGDFVVMVGNRIDIYSGISPYPVLYTKTFTSTNLRIAVGDVNNDNNPDLAVIYPLAVDNAQVEVYTNGDISSEPSFFTTVPIGNSNDIKIGRVKDGGKNSIVTLTRQNNSTSSNIRIIDYDENAIGSLSVTATTSITNSYAPNDNITLCRFRGSMSPADIVAQNSVLRYNTQTLGFSNYSSGILSGYTINIFPDEIVSGNFNNDPDGIETVEYITRGFNFGTNSSPSYSVGTWSSKIAIASCPITYPSTYWDGYRTCYVEGYTYIPFSFTGGIVKLNEVQRYRTLSATTVAATAFSYKTTNEYTIANAMTITYSGGSGTIYNFREWDGASIGTFYTYITSINIPASPYAKNYTGFNYGSLASVRSTESGRVLRYIEHNTSMSEPRIYALLAAPPYYKYKKDGTTYEYSNYGSMGTSWGKSQVTGTGTNNASSNSVSAIFGYEQDFNIPVIGTKVGSIEFTTKLEWEWTSSTEKEYTTTQSIEFTTAQQDAVILTGTFYDTYTYEIISSGNPDEIGTNLNISLPAGTRTMGLTLNDYERLTADDRSVPNLRNLFKHKEGYPFTYPSDKSQIASNLSGASVLWAMPFGGEEFVSIGSGTDVNRSIALDETTSQTSGFNFNMDMELVVTAMGVKAGAGYGHGNTDESSHTESDGHSIAGHVLGPNQLGDVTDFRWTVCWYKYRLGGQEFPVIYYVVKP